MKTLIESVHLRPNPPVSLIASVNLERIVSRLSYGGNIIWLKHVDACHQAMMKPGMDAMLVTDNGRNSQVTVADWRYSVAQTHLR